MGLLKWTVSLSSHAMRKLWEFGHAAFLAQRKDNACAQVTWRDTGLQEGPGTALLRVSQVPCSRKPSQGQVGFHLVDSPSVRTCKEDVRGRAARCLAGTNGLLVPVAR